MEEKKEIRVRLSTAISMVIIFALIVALGVTYYFGFVANKKENVGEEKVTNTTENIVTDNKTDKEDIKKEENKVKEDKVNNTIKNETEEKEDNNYKEITKKLEGIDGLYVTDVIKNKNKTYTLKGVIYSQYKLTHDELRKIQDKGKMKINDIEYIVSQDEEDPTIYNLIYKDDKEEFVNYQIKPLNNNEYFLECWSNISDVWELTDEYRQITIPADNSCKVIHEFGEETEKSTVEKEFGNYKKKEPKETANPYMIYNFEFKNGKVVEVYSLRTGV